MFFDSLNIGGKARQNFDTPSLPVIVGFRFIFFKFKTVEKIQAPFSMPVVF
jgi:hypothetical protein